MLVCTYMLEYVGGVSERIPKMIVRVHRGKHTGWVSCRGKLTFYTVWIVYHDHVIPVKKECSKKKKKKERVFDYLK